MMNGPKGIQKPLGFLMIQCELSRFLLPYNRFRGWRGVSELAPEELDEADLDELAAMANKLHAEVEKHEQDMLQAACDAGQVLIKAKELAGHGNWLSWLEVNFKGSEDTAERYMTLASNSARVRNMDAGTSLRAAVKLIRESEDTVPGRPSKRSKNKGKRGLPKMATTKFHKRYNSLSDDIGYLAQSFEEDEDFAMVVFSELKHLEEQRDSLTKLIKAARARFKGKESNGMTE